MGNPSRRTAITVSAVYANNQNTVCFDGIQLYKEEFGSSYTYDKDGNLISVVDLQKKNTTYEYDENTGANGTISSTAEYTDNKNLLHSTTNTLGKTTYYGYNVDTGILEWVQYPEDSEKGTRGDKGDKRTVPLSQY